MLPKISIVLGQGGTGQTNQTADGVSALILEGVAVAGIISLHETKTVYSVDELTAIGITSGGANDYAFTQIKGFYDEAGEGAELFIMLTDKTLTQSLDLANAYAKQLLSDASGKVRLLGAGRKKQTTPTITNGLNADAHAAVAKAQVLAEDFTSRYRPLRVAIGGNSYSGTASALKDYTTDDKNRVAMFIGADNSGKYASVGKFIGRLAKSPVQRKPSRVLDGAVKELTEAYLTDGAVVEDAENAWDTIHDKGYCFYRNHVGRAGYYYTGDPTLTTGADDYNSIARGRVIDKAYIITYDVLLNHLSDEVEINADGTMSPGLIKAWEGEIENAIVLQMKQYGEISNVFIDIDPKQNVISTNKVEVTVKIQPVGYADFIDVKLGYTISQS